MYGIKLFGTKRSAKLLDNSSFLHWSIISSWYAIFIGDKLEYIIRLSSSILPSFTKSFLYSKSAKTSFSLISEISRLNISKNVSYNSFSSSFKYTKLGRLSSGVSSNVL